MLRRRREEVGQDLVTVAANTHIRQNYLKAIEEGRRRDLPGTAYMIGYVRTYADYLGFDGNRLISDFHAQLAGQRKKPEKRAEPESGGGLPQIQISPAILLVALLAVGVAAYAGWSYFSGDEEVTETASVETPDAPAEPAASADPAAVSPVGSTDGGSIGGAEASATDRAQPEATADETPASATEDQVPPEADVAAATEEVTEESPPQPEEAAESEKKAGKIVVRARLESWIQVTNASKEVVFSRVLRVGETYTVPDEKGLVLTTGNAGGVEILLDGKKLKSLGTVGLVRRGIPLDPKKLKDGSAFKVDKAVSNAQ
ncbi:MAG: RodZ domain-containing protein [Dongiaceae bacterium]